MRGPRRAGRSLLTSTCDCGAFPGRAYVRGRAQLARQLVELLTGRTDWSSGCWCRGVVDFAICFVEGLALGLEFGPGRISG